MINMAATEEVRRSSMKSNNTMEEVEGLMVQLNKQMVGDRC